MLLLLMLTYGMQILHVSTYKGQSRNHGKRWVVKMVDHRAGDQGARVGQVMEQHMGDQGGRDRWGIIEQGIKVLEWGK